MEYLYFFIRLIYDSLIIGAITYFPIFEAFSLSKNVFLIGFSYSYLLNVFNKSTKYFDLLKGMLLEIKKLTNYISI